VAGDDEGGADRPSKEKRKVEKEIEERKRKKLTTV
jgi:hypothetical protein